MPNNIPCQKESSVSHKIKFVSNAMFSILSYQGIDTLKDVGCFGLTELGYGNNAVEMETTATYDKQTQEFIVNTPTTVAQKYWITNGALHAQHCVVFAQLIIDGKNHGKRIEKSKNESNFVVAIKIILIEKTFASSVFNGKCDIKVLTQRISWFINNRSLTFVLYIFKAFMVSW